jgi:hypothetical protein
VYGTIEERLNIEPFLLASSEIFLASSIPTECENWF